MDVLYAHKIRETLHKIFQDNKGAKCNFVFNIIAVGTSRFDKTLRAGP